MKTKTQVACGTRTALGLKVAIPIGLTCFATACLDKTPVDPGLYDHLSIVEDSASLSARVTYIDETPVDIIPVAGGGGSTVALARVQLSLQARVAPPTVGGTALQASHVIRDGNRAYVGYNVRGDAYRGGVDVFDGLQSSRPQLTSQALFFDTDVSALDKSGDDLYLATATANESFDSPAVLELLHLRNGGRAIAETTSRIPLTSFAATGVTASGGLTYVTTGSSGGLTILDSDHEPVFSDALADARAVAVENGYIVVMAGTPGMLRVYDATSRALLRDIPLGGASIPESKGSLFVIRDHAYVATGDGGVVVADIATGQVLERLPVPSVPGVPAEASVSNGLTWHANFLFIANGEAGLWVAEASNGLGNGGGAPGLSVLGRIDVGGSANYVQVRGNRLFVASGVSGLNIIRIKN